MVSSLVSSVTGRTGGLPLEPVENQVRDVLGELLVRNVLGGNHLLIDQAVVVPVPTRPDVDAIAPAESPFAELSLRTQRRLYDTHKMTRIDGFRVRGLGLPPEAALYLCKHRATLAATEMTEDLRFGALDPVPFWTSYIKACYRGERHAPELAAWMLLRHGVLDWLRVAAHAARDPAPARP